MTTNITEMHRTAFNYIREAGSRDVALFSCFVNGEATAAIVRVESLEDGTFSLSPMFVAITPGMKLTDHEGIEPKSEGN